MKKTRKLLSFIMAVIMLLSILPVTAFAAGDEDAQTPPEAGLDIPDGLEMRKTVTTNGDGSYTVELETYITGTVTADEKSVPLDILLVLDQSGSMTDRFSGYFLTRTTNQDALKTSVKQFIDTVNVNYNAADADHRIAMIEFASSASLLSNWTYVNASGRTALRNTIDNLPTPNQYGTTMAGGAMELAEDMMLDQYSYDGSNTERKKIVVYFSDGEPGSGSFDITEANKALAAAYNLKEADVTLFSVAIYPNANVNETYASTAKYAGDYVHTSDTGAVGEYWQCGVFDDISAPLANRFMNYLSSNYPSADGMGLLHESVYVGTVLLIPVYNNRYTITADPFRESNTYFLTASDQEGLDEVFQKIYAYSVTPSIYLGSETIIRDVVTDTFKIPDGAQIRLYTADCIGKNADDEFVFGAKTAFADGSIVRDGNTVSVSGFDFDSNACVEINGNTYSGKKLIVEFDIVPADVTSSDTPYIYTNSPASGIYIPDSEGEEEPAAYFELPTIEGTKVIIRYVDENGTPIAGDDIYYAVPNSSFAAQASEIDGYVLLPDEEETVTQAVGTETVTIVFRYSPLFYIVHHASDGSSDDVVEAVAMCVLDEDGAIDITRALENESAVLYNGVREGYIYGGMYAGDHNGAAAGENFNYTDAETALCGKALKPQAGKYYYLREVSEDFLQPKIISVRRFKADTHLEHYLLTVIDADGADNGFYTEYGFIYDPACQENQIINNVDAGVVNWGENEEIYHERVDEGGEEAERYDNMGCCLYDYINVYVNSDKPTSVYEQTTVFPNTSITDDDYFGCIPYNASRADAGTVTENGTSFTYNFHYAPYYVTADHVFVSGIKERYTNISNTASTSAVNLDEELADGSVTCYFSREKKLAPMMVAMSFAAKPTALPEIVVEAENLVSLSLDGTIGANFYLDLDHYKNVSKVTVTYVDPAKETASFITDTYTEFDEFASNGKYLFTVNASAAQTTEAITVKVYGAYDNVLYYKETCIRDILESYIRSYDGTPIGELCENMLTYAGYSQIFFDYKTEDLANKKFSAPVDNVTAELVEGYNVVTSGNGSLVYYAQNISCRFSTIARYAFTVASGVNTDGFYAQFENGGEGTELTLSRSGNQLIVNVSGIAAAQLDESYTIAIFNADGECQETLTAAPLTYVKSVLNNKNASAELVNLAKALYNYNAAAHKVFG